MAKSKKKEGKRDKRERGESSLDTQEPYHDEQPTKKAKPSAKLVAKPVAKPVVIAAPAAQDKTVPKAVLTKKPETKARFQSTEKEALKKEGKSIFIALPNTMRGPKTSKFKDLYKWAAETKAAHNGITTLTESGYSYIVARYRSSGARDAAMQIFRSEKCTLGGTTIVPVVERFGEKPLPPARSSTWLLRQPVLASVNQVGHALVAYQWKHRDVFTSPQPFKLMRLLDHNVPTQSLGKL